MTHGPDEGACKRVQRQEPEHEGEGELHDLAPDHRCQLRRASHRCSRHASPCCSRHCTRNGGETGHDAAEDHHQLQQARRQYRRQQPRPQGEDRHGRDVRPGLEFFRQAVGRVPHADECQRSFAAEIGIGHVEPQPVGAFLAQDLITGGVPLGEAVHAQPVMLGDARPVGHFRRVLLLADSQRRRGHLVHQVAAVDGFADEEDQVPVRAQVGDDGGPVHVLEILVGRESGRDLQVRRADELPRQELRYRAGLHQARLVAHPTQ